MTLFLFELARDGRNLGKVSSVECPDCGTAFREAKHRIARLRQEMRLPEGELPRFWLRVMYDDGSELFHIPFGVGV